MSGAEEGIRNMTGLICRGSRRRNAGCGWREADVILHLRHPLFVFFIVLIVIIEPEWWRLLAHAGSPHLLDDVNAVRLAFFVAVRVVSDRFLYCSGRLFSIFLWPNN